MKTILNWHKIKDLAPQTSDLPILVYCRDINQIMSFTRICPVSLEKEDFWANVTTPEDEPMIDFPKDPLDQYGHLKSIREAIIASSNGESADHARRLFNETFLRGVK